MKKDNKFENENSISKTSEINTNLKNVAASCANFSNGIWNGSDFSNSDLSHSNFNNSVLKDVNFENADLSYVTFHNAELFNIKINKETNCHNTIFGNAILSVSNKCKENEVIYALSKGILNNTQFVNPVFGRKVRDEAWLTHYKNSRKTIFEKIVAELWFYTSDYGRSLLRWSILVYGLFGIFGYIYQGNPQWFELTNEQFNTASWFTPFYYSVVTFTTLGFGDITPKLSCGLAQFTICLEVIIGYIMLGGLISILANKLARRND